MRINLKILGIAIIISLFPICDCLAQNVKIIFAGDLMGHTPQHTAALQKDGTYDYNPCFRYVKDYIQSADLAILNLEVTLAGPPYTGYPEFSSPKALAQAAKDAGFDIMMTANNHCMDRGKHGLEKTIFVLDSLGIPHLGTYVDTASHDREHPMFVECNDVKLALLCYTYGTNGKEVFPPNVVNFIDTTEMSRDLDIARSGNPDFIITLIHWGIEYDVHSSYIQERRARWLLEHGSDVVIGGHSHVVQNFTLDANPDNDIYPEIVVYSMGNLVSNQRKVNTDGGIMIELDLVKNEENTEVYNCRYMPYWVNRGTVDGLYQYYIVPSTDAVENPESYQIRGEAFKALKLFSNNTRARLDSCAMKSGANIIEHRVYKNMKFEP